ncbi:uncharacterized protein LOC131879454 isoform X2 [Tigriopus californicus]|uniref:uncharacterized protein LOC131879454 isoform X2 n=1 Tax=Tigriopus californicus TaxID=6832 RepID=UPI0027DA7122|nr:uncharacterized protein LOC131879454 isoform X2 [Tigriopus californicus]
MESTMEEDQGKKATETPVHELTSEEKSSKPQNLADESEEPATTSSSDEFNGNNDSQSSVGVAKEERTGVVHPVVPQPQQQRKAFISGIKIPIGHGLPESEDESNHQGEVQVLKCECASDSFLGHHHHHHPPFSYQSAFPPPRVAFIISDADHRSRVTHNSVTRITTLNNGVVSVGSSSPRMISSPNWNGIPHHHHHQHENDVSRGSPTNNMTRSVQNQNRNNAQQQNTNEVNSNHIISASSTTDHRNYSSDSHRAITSSKEQRRRERRERRARRHQQRNSAYGGDPYLQALYSGLVPLDGSVPLEGVPDFLHSHILPPPPYSTLPGGRIGRGHHPIAMRTVQPAQTASPRLRGWRQTVLPITAQDFGRSHFRHPPFFGDEDFRAGGSGSGKNCCGVHVTQTVSIRWFIVMIAFLGICCSVVGTVLGALKASGREHLTVSLLMIGVGIVLITVSGIAWRLTATDAPSCRALLGIGGPYEEDYTHGGRFLSRPPMGYNGPYSGGGGGAGGGTSGQPAASAAGRAQHPYAAMMYSDFNYRPPPPTYQASMQEYRLRLLLMDRQGANTGGSGGPGLASANACISPPPQYRAQLRTALANAMVHSRPPSYQSQVSEQHQVIVPPIPVSNHAQGTNRFAPQSGWSEGGNATMTTTTTTSTLASTLSSAPNSSPITTTSVSARDPHQVHVPASSSSSQNGVSTLPPNWSQPHRALVHHARMISGTSPNITNINNNNSTSESSSSLSVGIHHTLPVSHHRSTSNSSSPQNSPMKKSMAEDEESAIVAVTHDYIPSKTNRSTFGKKRSKHANLQPQHHHHHHSQPPQQQPPSNPHSSLVTIVSTPGDVSDSSNHTLTNNIGDSVIVTVSGSITDSTQYFRSSPGEVEILAHL